MIDAYSLPHECEKEELATLLARLDRSQRRALRSYVWNVELGEKSVKEWIGSEGCPVSNTAWYRHEQRNFLRHPAFAAALTAYLEAGLKWQTDEESKAIRRASRLTALATPDAAQTQIDLMKSAEREEVKLKAAQGILDRAGLATAKKGVSSVVGEDGGAVETVFRVVYGDDRIQNSSA